MAKYYVVLSSVTTAQRFNKILTQNAIKSGFVHTPRRISAGGCSYSMIVNGKQLADAIRLAGENRIVIKAVYEKKTDDSFVQITL